ncbi:MAG: hypothetical protein E7419_00430 [Ruminococcaceae bacterium]|nr:hypothetical protein [Oscillospiraceae bacterium]
MKRFISMFLILIICLSTYVTSFAKINYDIDFVLNDIASYILKTVPNPKVGSVGGEWTVLGLSRSGIEITDEYYMNYYENAEEYVKKNKGNLHDKKYTEYARVIVALTSIGKSPEDVAGYNLLTPLGDYEKTIWQGINGAIWALIALDCGNYDMPDNPDATIQATREMYINYILDNRTSDGGWALSGDTANPDITGMALCALSKYQYNKSVKNAINTALDTMSKNQDDKGGFSSFGTPNSESCVQMLVALSELGISINDSRFVKNGYTILDNLMTCYVRGKGFTHENGGNSSNLMATEQAFYGIVSVKRASTGKPGLFQMSDAVSFFENTESLIGLKNKNKDVMKMDVILPGKTFTDIAEYKEKTKIEALAERGIINGKSENIFDPDGTMTRAEFATIITKGLGIYKKSNIVFKDVNVNDWFYNYVSIAYSYGIIKGISENEFNPNGTVSREEAAVMIARASELCGMDTEMDIRMVRDVLAQFSDYISSSEWSQSSLAFCYSEKILDDSVMDIKPKEAVTRGEFASMFYKMISLAELI